MATTAHQDRITWSSLIRHAIPNDQVVVVDLVMMVVMVVVMVVVAKEHDTVTLSSLPTSSLYRVCDGDCDGDVDALWHRTTSWSTGAVVTSSLYRGERSSITLMGRQWPSAPELGSHWNNNDTLTPTVPFIHSFIHSVSHPSSSSCCCCCDCLTITKRER